MTQKRIRSLATEYHLEFLQYSVTYVNRDRPSLLNTEICKSRTFIVMMRVGAGADRAKRNGRGRWVENGQI